MNFLYLNSEHYIERGAVRSINEWNAGIAFILAKQDKRSM